MFEKHEVWERCEEYILVHVIFRDLETGRYHLQQTNYLYPGRPEEIAKQVAEHRYYVVDLFCEESPAERVNGYATIREAVEAEMREFGG
jgi:hypothetical protein